MLEIYTVSFFGHRKMESPFRLEEQLARVIRDLVKSKDYVEFLVGRNGEFDQLVSSSIRLVKRAEGGEKCSHTLVLPYESAELRENRAAFDRYYDNIELFPGTDTAHFKAAIQMRNREMVDRSDLIAFYLEHDSGGAYQTYRYAKKQGKNVLLLSANNGRTD